MSHVTHTNESCHTGDDISVRGFLVKDTVLLVQMSHVTHIDESCHTYG